MENSNLELGIKPSIINNPNLNPYAEWNSGAEQPITPSRTNFHPYKVEFTITDNADERRDVLFRYADEIIDEKSIITTKGRSKEMYIFKNGIYVHGEYDIRQRIREDFEEVLSSHHIKELLEIIRDKTFADNNIFEVDKNYLNFQNGIYDLKNKCLLPHHPSFRFLRKIPVEYDGNADCPTITNFLKEVLDDAEIKIIEEWTGFCLYRDYFIKKAIIFVGERDTGKSTLINLLEGFFGKENTSGVSLQKIASDKFASSNFYQKHINIFDDLSFKDINDNGAFKIATGGGIITGEKKFGDQFQFSNYAKLTFACNKIPDVKDADDDAYFSRWIPVHFSYRVDKSKKDPALKHKLTQKSELSGFLNIALKGLERLLEQKDFSYDKSPTEIKNEMLSSGSSIAKFAYECLEPAGIDSSISKENMYTAFQSFATANGLSKESMKNLGIRLPKILTFISEGKPTSRYDGKQINSWMGVKLREEHKNLIPAMVVSGSQEEAMENIDWSSEEDFKPELF